jgi:hypothetical protein
MSERSERKYQKIFQRIQYVNRFFTMLRHIEAIETGGQFCGEYGCRNELKASGAKKSKLCVDRGNPYR